MKSNFNQKPVLLRITTVPQSFRGFLQGQMKFLSHWFDAHACSSPGWQLTEIGEKENVPIHEIKMERAPSIKNDLKSLMKMYQLMRKLKPAIVHTETPKAGLIGMVAAWMARVPVRIHTVAGLPWMEISGKKQKALMALEKFNYSFATQVYSNSNNLRQFLIDKHLIKSNRIGVIGNGTSNGINTSHYKNTPEIIEEGKNLRKSFGWTDDEVVMLFIGRLVKDKGIVELMEAFTNLYKNYPQIRLLLVGHAEPHRDPLPQKTLDAIEKHPAVKTPGYALDVRPWFAMADLLVFPSYREGFPNVPLQSGSQGVPMILTDINGCNEIVENEKNGLIIPTKNGLALEVAMKKFLDKPDFRKNMGINAQKLVYEKYGQENFWQELLKEYKRQLAEKGIAIKES